MKQEPRDASPEENLGRTRPRGRQIGADDDIPRDSGILGHVEQQRGVSVRERTDDVVGPDCGETGHAVGPRSEVVPGTRERVQLSGVVIRGVDARFEERGVEVFAVQGIECHELASTGPDGFHGRLVAVPPPIGERGCVQFELVAFRVARHSGGDTGAQSTTVPNVSNNTARILRPVDRDRNRVPPMRRPFARTYDVAPQ